MTDWKYRGWRIDCDPKPIPCRSFDWTATHPDYDVDWCEDGPSDNGLKAHGSTYEELCAEINYIEEELNDR